MLFRGLQYLPGSSHEFAVYLWRTLALPVASYGFEVSWTDALVEQTMTHHVSGWCRLLRIGKRTPVDVVAALMGLHCCSLDRRVRRASLFIRLLNSPPDSLQQ
eukprot:3073358-Karenia_brevis.AAC.1